MNNVFEICDKSVKKNSVEEEKKKSQHNKGNIFKFILILFPGVMMTPEGL